MLNDNGPIGWKEIIDYLGTKNLLIKDTPNIHIIKNYLFVGNYVDPSVSMFSEIDNKIPYKMEVIKKELQNNNIKFFVRFGVITWFL